MAAQTRLCAGNGCGFMAGKPGAETGLEENWRRPRANLSK